MTVETVPLRDLCDVRIGRTPSRSDPRYWGGPGIWVSISELNGHELSDSREHISELAMQDVMPPPVPAGTLLFSFKLSIGKMAVSAVPLYTNEAIAALPIRDPERLDREYLRYALMATSGAAQTNHAVLGAVLNKAKVEALPIPLVPISEQRHIVDLLSRAESIVRMRREAEVKAKEIIPALFVEMFGDPEKNPKGWDSHPLDMITDRITYGFTCPMKHLSVGIPIVTAKNVIDGRIDLSDVHFADESEFIALTAKSKPLPGDVLVTKDGTIGRCAAVDAEAPFCINQSVALVRPMPGKVLPEFIVGFLRYPTILESLQTMGKGQALKHLQITELAKKTIPVPPMALQQKYANHMKSLKSLHHGQEGAENAAARTFKSLLSGVFGNNAQ